MRVDVDCTTDKYVEDEINYITLMAHIPTLNDVYRPYATVYLTQEDIDYLIQELKNKKLI